MNQHSIKVFDEEINKLRFRLVRLATFTFQQIDLVFKALIEQNTSFAQEAREIEDKIDNLDLKIDAQCQRILALYQPVAADLRLVMIGLSLNDLFEFIGDLSVDFAKDLLNSNLNFKMILKQDFQDMQDKFQVLNSILMRAFVNNELQSAFQALQTESKLIEMINFNYTQIQNACLKNEIEMENGFLLVKFNRALFYTSKLIRTIAQDFVFLIEAKNIKHQDDDILADVQNVE